MSDGKGHSAAMWEPKPDPKPESRGKGEAEKCLRRISKLKKYALYPTEQAEASAVTQRRVAPSTV